MFIFSLFFIKDNGFYINDFILWCKGQGPAWKTTYTPNGSDIESEIDEDELEVFEEDESEESDDEANSGEENTVQSNVVGTSGAKDTSKGNQSLRWRKSETVQ